MSRPYWQQLQEQEYFNWQCIICSIIAQSPLHLEDQWLVEHGPHTDIDGQKWVKCSKCLNAFHVNCLVAKPSVGEYFCTFFSCQK